MKNKQVLSDEELEKISSGCNDGREACPTLISRESCNNNQYCTWTDLGFGIGLCLPVPKS